jgi:hypothetical protein
VKPEKRLLYDLFGEFVVAKVPPREAEQDWPVALEQRTEGCLVAIDVGVHELFVGGCRFW